MGMANRRRQHRVLPPGWRFQCCWCAWGFRCGASCWTHRRGDLSPRRLPGRKGRRWTECNGASCPACRLPDRPM